MTEPQAEVTGDDHNGESVLQDAEHEPVYAAYLA